MTRGHAETFLVDGYNVIRRDSRLHEAEMQLGLAGGRRALLTRIQAASHHRNSRIIVVFDGASHAATVTSETHGRIEVRFSRPPQNADQAIIALLDTISQCGSVAVVTADRELAWQARSRGASVLDPQDWLPTPRSRRPGRGKRPADPGEKPAAARSEVEWGLAVFGEAQLRLGPAAGPVRPEAPEPSSPDPGKDRLKARRKTRYLNRRNRGH